MRKNTGKALSFALIVILTLCMVLPIFANDSPGAAKKQNNAGTTEGGKNKATVSVSLSSNGATIANGTTGTAGTGSAAATGSKANRLAQSGTAMSGSGQSAQAAAENPVTAGSGQEQQQQQKQPASNASTNASASVKISDKSSVRLKQAYILQAENGKVVSFTLTIFNGESTDLQFIDYWTKLRSKSGDRFSAKLVTADQEKKQIAPQTSTDYTFYAKVNNAVELTDLIIEFIKWDFSQPDYQKKLGDLTVPANYAMVTPAGQKKTIDVANIPLATTIEKFTMDKGKEFNETKITYQLVNEGSRSITVPQYNFFMRTDDGLIYKMDAANADSLSIQPRVKKKIELTAEIPTEVQPKEWQLVVTQAEGNEKIDIPVAFYRLQEAEEDVYSGNVYEYTNDDGTYVLKLNGLQRLPWKDQDILSAHLSLINEGDEALPIPNVSGYFKLGGIKIDESKTRIVTLDNSASLQPGASVDLMMYITVPYTSHYNDIRLVLLDKTNGQEKPAEQIVEFAQSSGTGQIPTVELENAYPIGNLGKQATVMVKSANIYEDDASNIAYVELEMTNAEKRFTKLAKLEGVFKTSDDIYYPANVSVVETEISPNGKALVAVWSKLPKRYKLEDLQVLLGVGVKDNRIALSGEASDAFFNGSIMAIPASPKPAKTDFNNLELYPYTLTLSNVFAGYLTSGYITLDYKLEKEETYEASPAGHKLVIEFEDEDVKYSREYELGKDLKVGEGSFDENDFIIDVADLQTKLGSFGSYQLNIYDQFEGHKRLIASRVLDWFREQ